VKTIVLVLGALALVVAAALVGGPLLERNRRLGEIQALRDRREVARYAVDSCRNALGLEEARFLRFDRMVDSLREAVHGFEDPVRGGVPQALYTEYMATFRAYNDSVAVWEIRADTLKAHEASCRALVDGHNLLTDSLVRLRDGMAGEG
jgi:hypothetical protein